MKNKPRHIPKMGSETWLTPPDLIKSLGEFDLDPCTPVDRPWDTAKHHFNIIDDGLKQNWFGRVWMNPPYGRKAKAWLEKLSGHKNGTALVFARTETEMFFNHVWDDAESILFMKGRIFFHLPDGTRAKANSGAPSVLIAYDEFNAEMIEQSGIEGKHIYLKNGVFVFGLSKEEDKTWKVVVGESIEKLGGEAEVKDIYEAVIKLSPSKIKNNKNYKAKIRQTLQRHFDKVEKGIYKN